LKSETTPKILSRSLVSAFITKTVGKNDNRLSGKLKLLEMKPVGAAFQPRIKTIAVGKPLPQNPIHLFFPDIRKMIFGEAIKGLSNLHIYAAVIL